MGQHRRSEKLEDMRIRFLSGNGYKISEASAILGAANVEVVPVNLDIPELQTSNVELIVRDKTLKAFDRLGHPLFVEQTGLYLDRMNGFPGGLTRVFWDSLGPEKMCQLFGLGDETGVEARTRIGYCDGRKIYQFEGSIRGRIAAAPRGDQRFQWDCVFIPEGHNQTFAELGELKNQISMRRRALDAFATHLKEHAHA
jgi:XTP/dITP diphosphohydrolase